MASLNVLHLISLPNRRIYKRSITKMKLFIYKPMSKLLQIQLQWSTLLSAVCQKLTNQVAGPSKTLYGRSFSNINSISNFPSYPA